MHSDRQPDMHDASGFHGQTLARWRNIQNKKIDNAHNNNLTFKTQLRGN